MARDDSRRAWRHEYNIDGLQLPAACPRSDLGRGSATGRALRSVGPPVLAVANQKGGVGKTATSLELVAAASRLGRALLIDMDLQANATPRGRARPRRMRDHHRGPAGQPPRRRSHHHPGGHHPVHGLARRRRRPGRDPLALRRSRIAWAHHRPGRDVHGARCGRQRTCTHRRWSSGPVRTVHRVAPRDRDQNRLDPDMSGLERKPALPPRRSRPIADLAVPALTSHLRGESNPDPDGMARKPVRDQGGVGPWAPQEPVLPPRWPHLRSPPARAASEETQARPRRRPAAAPRLCSAPTSCHGLPTQMTRIRRELVQRAEYAVDRALPEDRRLDFHLQYDGHR